MANGKFWTSQNQKLIASTGMGLSGYHIVSQAFVALPQLPEIISKPLFGQISLLTVAGMAAIYGVVMLYTQY